MHISLPSVLTALLVASEASAIMMKPRANHASLARRITRKKRCLQRTSSISPIADHFTPTSSPAAAQTTAASSPPPSDNNGGNNNNNGGNNNNNGGGSQSGTIQNAAGGQCGDPGATTDPTSTGGPNGSEMWLNCGITSGGWAPPPVTLDNMVYVDLGDALNNAGSPFSACSAFLSEFENMGGQTGVPAILLASIALQESGCNQGATGPNGEIGLMQITPDKCPQDGSDCYDPNTNISIGANYFKTVLSDAGGNVVQTMGEWNGWTVGMTQADANNYSTCGQRNNLDYLQNVFNGYLQGVDPSQFNMGIFFNTNC